MSTLRNSVRFATVAASLVCLTTAAQAQSTDVDAPVREGIEAFHDGHYEQALALFTTAWERGHVAKARAEMALTEQALGRWVDAETDLAEALGQASDPWITAHRADLETALSEIRGHTAVLEVRVNASGAELAIGSRPPLHLPLERPVPVPIGTVTFEVRAAGYVSVQRTVVSNPREHVVESVDLTRVQSATEVPPTPSRVVEQDGSRSASVPNAAPVTPAPYQFPVLPTLGLIGTGLGAATGILGAVLAVTGSSDYNTNNCPPPGLEASSVGVCRVAYDRTLVGNGLMIGGFVSGGVLLAASLIGFAVRGSQAGAAPRRQVSFGAGPTPFGASCTISF